MRRAKIARPRELFDRPRPTRIDTLPLDADDIVACLPIYEAFPGLKHPERFAKKLRDLLALHN